MPKMPKLPKVPKVGKTSDKKRVTSDKQNRMTGMTRNSSPVIRHLINNGQRTTDNGRPATDDPSMNE